MSQQLRISDQGFDHFYANLSKKAEKMQLHTGQMLWKYLAKNTQFADQSIQVGYDDVMENVTREIAGLHKQISIFKDGEKEFIRQLHE